jgi:hypothetical protein
MSNDFLHPEKAKKIIVYQEKYFYIQATDDCNYTEKMFECHSLEAALKIVPLFCSEIQRPDLVDKTYIILEDETEIKANMDEIINSNFIICLIKALEYNYGENWHKTISPSILKKLALTEDVFMDLIKKYNSSLITSFIPSNPVSDETAIFKVCDRTKSNDEMNNPFIDKYGNKRWYNEKSQIHREDGPAIEYADGDKEWRLNGLLHREDGPAIESANGDKYWYLNGKRHREDGPAVEFKNGEKSWYLNDKYYSEQAFNEKMKSTQNSKETKMNNLVVDVFGHKYWYNEQGKFHREDGPAVEYTNGDKFWYLKDQLHRVDGPAIEYANGDKSWYLNGKCHREDGPAVEWVNGNKRWYLSGKQYSEQEFNEKMKSTQKSKETKMNNPVVDVFGNKCWFNEQGNLHREDGPAFECSNGRKEWYLNGNLHREDGPAIEYPDGDKEWYLNGERHREDGPAIEFANGDKHWCLNGKRHREDGPAVEYENGDKYWYLNGQCYSEQVFKEKMKTVEHGMERMYVFRVKASEAHRYFVNCLIESLTSQSSDVSSYSWAYHSDVMDILLKATHGKLDADFKSLAKNGYMPFMLPNFNEIEKYYAEQSEIVGSDAALENLAVVITDDFGKALYIIPGNVIVW